MCAHWLLNEVLQSLALVRRVLQKLAMSSAEARPPTCLLQKASKASFRALWNSELLLKHSVTYCKQHTANVRQGLPLPQVVLTAHH